ncbi:MAG: hypothetical protein Ta2A_19200 [Treponemataceae bacterium]|nr:MAG: hypothetical protein Ta2A_19200 [Treponemataceae bacterium]
MWEAVDECHRKLNLIQIVLVFGLFIFLTHNNIVLYFVFNILMTVFKMKDPENLVYTMMFIVFLLSIILIRSLFTLGAILKYWHNKL